MNFKLKSRHLFIAILVVGIGFVLFGLAQAIFHLSVDPELDKNLSTVFFIAVAGLYVYMRQLRKKEEAEKTEEKNTGNPPEDETNKSEDSRD